MVINEGASLSKVVKKLKLKLTTARLILQKYRETGGFPRRAFKTTHRCDRHLLQSEAESFSKDKQADVKVEEDSVEEDSGKADVVEEKLPKIEAVVPQYEYYWPFLPYGWPN